MTPKEILYGILSRALMDIRSAAYEKKNHESIFKVADLIHNLPLTLQSMDTQSGDFELLLTELKQRAEMKKCDTWLNATIQDLKN